VFVKCYVFPQLKINHISGVMGRVLASTAVGRKVWLVV